VTNVDGTQDGLLAAAFNAGMTGSARHVNENERRMHESSATPGQTFTEAPATVDDVDAGWSG
jgi:hypothetical protein